MEIINMHCKSISQIQLGAYSGLKIISLVECIYNIGFKFGCNPIKNE